MTPFSQTLTDTEWMSIINRDRDGLPPCCANISQLRDTVISLAREDEPRQGRLRGFLELYSRESTDHLEEFPKDHALRKLATAAAHRLGGEKDANLDGFINEMAKEESALREANHFAQQARAFDMGWNDATLFKIAPRDEEWREALGEDRWQAYSEGYAEGTAYEQQAATGDTDAAVDTLS